jgi:hypothetical protein
MTEEVKAPPMPRDVYGCVVSLFYTPPKYLAQQEAAWREWCSKAPKAAWPEWIERWSAKRKAEKRR